MTTEDLDRLMADRDECLRLDDYGVGHDFTPEIDALSLEIFRTTAFLHQGCKRK